MLSMISAIIKFVFKQRVNMIIAVMLGGVMLSVVVLIAAAA